MDLKPIHQGKIVRIQRLLKEFGLNPPPETATRYTKVLMSIAEQREDIDSIKGGRFEEKYEGMVIEKDIPIFSYCEHHILPWFGQVHIGYIAHNRVLGISKFTRIVNYYASGITIQERVTDEIAHFFSDNVSPDIIVMIEGIHTCKVARGVQNPFSRSITIEALGLFRTDTGPRIEFFESIGSTRKSA